MDDYMKYRVFDELVRPEVDAMFFNEHGSPDKQHVGSYTTEPDSFDGQYSQLKAEVMIALYMERRKGDKADVEGAKQYFKEKYHLTDAFFETKKTEADDDTKAKGDQTIVSLEDLETLAAQPRFVMLNACYNGSFHKPGYITATTSSARPHGGHAGQYGQRTAGAAGPTSWAAACCSHGVRARAV